MKVFLFAGSKGGCGRTTASVLCATGLAFRGYRVAHLQVLAPGRDGIRISPLAPFSSLYAGRVDQLRTEIAGGGSARRTLSDVLVVDLPIHKSFELDLGTTEATLFFTVRPGMDDYVALYEDIVDLSNKLRQRPQCLSGLNGFHVVPLGFSNKQYSRLQSSLAMFERERLFVAFSVITPGVPYLDPLDLHLWIGGGEFAPNPQECFYAKELADTAWRCADMQI